MHDEFLRWEQENAYSHWGSPIHSTQHFFVGSSTFQSHIIANGGTNHTTSRSPGCIHIHKTLEEQILGLTYDAGRIPADLAAVLEFVVEVFILVESCSVDGSQITKLWRHSLKTGYLAALIALNEKGGQRMVWQSFVGGIIHDIGMLLFFTQHPKAFAAVVDRAQHKGWDLPVVERQFMGCTHAEIGTAFMRRWEIDETLLAIVAFHDDPVKVPHVAFGPLTAVYAANLVEGGGMAQDCDGVIGEEGEAYLLRLGLWDDLPLWQQWMRGIHHLAI